MSVFLNLIKEELQKIGEMNKMKNIFNKIRMIFHRITTPTIVYLNLRFWQHTADEDNIMLSKP